MTIRPRKSSIMELIGPELSELFPFEFAKIAESDCLHHSIYKCRPISTKHGHSIYDDEILDEFRLWVKSDSNIWSYLPLNKEKLFNLTLFTL